MLLLGYKQVGKEFPVFIHPETGDEYALARKEVSTGNRYTDFKFDFNPNVTLREDLERRDFTMNALALDDEGCIVDFFTGKKDIKNKLIRHVNKRHFIEDPLRVLRACRLAAQLDFSIHSSTIVLCRQMVKLGMLNSLTPERVWLEIEKALHTPNFSLFLHYLSLCNALQIILPEIAKLSNIPERVDYHPEGNTFAHLMLALRKVYSLNNPEVFLLNKPNTEELALINFGLLCHDLGKLLTPPEELPSHHEHDKRGLIIIEELCHRLKIPNKYRDFGKLSCKYHMIFYNFLAHHTKKQYDIIKDISSNFKNWNTLYLLFGLHFCDLFGRAGKVESQRIANYRLVLFRIKRIYDIMEGVTLKNLSESTQKRLSKYKGEKFGKIYRDEMISYLKKHLNIIEKRNDENF